MLPSAEFLLRHSSDAILILDDQSIVRRANRRAETLLLTSFDRMVGSRLGELIPDFSGSQAETGLLAHMESGGLERRIDHFSPSRYTSFEIRAVKEGSLTALFMRDVTDRMRQTRTEAVREMVRQVINDAPVAISITRGPDHRYELVNNFAQRLVGDRELEGRMARAAFPEVDPSLFAILDDVYATGRTVTLEDLEVAFDREGAGILTRGTFDVTYQPLFDPDGTVTGVLSISVETTAYNEMRRSLENAAKVT